MNRPPPIQAVLETISPADHATRVEEATRLVENVRALFLGQLPYRERTRLLLLWQPRMIDALDSLGAALRAHASSGGKLDVAALGTAWDVFAQGAEALAEEEATTPIRSRSPFWNVLLRLAHGHHRGLIERQALQTALDELRGQHRGARIAIERAAAEGQADPRLQARRKELFATLDTMTAALENAHRALRQQQTDEVLALLTDGGIAADTLVDLQMELERTAGGQRPCLRCGTPNATTARHCVGCSAKLPAVSLGDEMEASLDVTVEDGVRTSGHAHNQLVDAVSGAVAEFEARRMTPDAFARALDEATAHARAAIQRVRDLPVPSDASESDRAVLDETAAIMREGLHEFLEGIEELRRYLIDGNVVHLEQGLETALTGADKVAHVRTITTRTE